MLHCAVVDVYTELYFMCKSFKFLNSLFVLVLASVFFASCNNRLEPRPKEDTPVFVDIAVDAINEIKNTKGNEAAIAYIDSIRGIYINRSLSDKYYMYYVYADTYERLNDNDKTNKYCDTIINLLEENDPSNFWFNNYIWAYFFKADIELKKGNLDEAYEYYYKVLYLAEEYGDRCAIGYYYLRTGHIIYSTEHYEDAAVYFKRAFDESNGCIDNFGSFLRQQQTINNIGLCYEKANMYDSAIYYYKEGIRYIESNYKRFTNTKHWLADVAIAVINGNLAGIYVKQGKVEGVEEMLLNSINTNEKIGHDLTDAQYTRIKLSHFYLQNNRLKEAKELLDLVKSINDTLYNYTVWVRWNGAMSTYCEIKNNPANAFVYYKAYKNGLDSLHKSRINFSLANVDNNVKNLGKEYKIASLEQSANLRKISLAIALIIAALASIIAILVFRNSGRTKKHIRTLQEMNHQINHQKLKIKEAFDDLEAADSEKDRILKAVSHDMRSPVNSAIALIDLLEEDKDDFTEEQKEYLSLLRNSCQNALTLTNDLLEIATLQADKLEKEMVDLNILVKNRVDLIKFRAAEKKQLIDLRLPDNHLSARINSDKFSRVIGNLITNSIKFSPDNTTIKVELAQENEHFLFSVKDSGIGIPESIKGKIFDIFTDAKRYGTSGEQPFGLGLSISKQIVEAHLGKIWFESKEGEGTTFYVSIPLSS
ncbi:MAG: ATP-binding protein [Flavipsychrobacter sp.]